MNPAFLLAVVSGIEQLVGFLIEARKNGSISDAELEAATAGANIATRKLIADALAKHAA